MLNVHLPTNEREKYIDLQNGVSTSLFIFHVSDFLLQIYGSNGDFPYLCNVHFSTLHDNVKTRSFKHDLQPKKING